ncbi:hypothetical protein [Streptosporangium sp. NPDC001681]|uniref:hypothetical protein n=1 Tax=Streptosporangium sp. NPDC001681 TaxID=3154395 RepID=UPI00331C56E2
MLISADHEVTIADLRRTFTIRINDGVAATRVASSHYVGLAPRRLAEQYGQALGICWFPIPADLPEIDVRLLWHARLDVDPAQRWLRDTIRDTFCSPS